MTLTRARTIQYVGILFSLMLIAVGYWYFSVRAGVKMNSDATQPQGLGQLDSGLFAYFSFDENTGTSTTDKSTNGLTGTLTNGPTWTTGQIGSAVDFDGTNDYVTTASTTFVPNNYVPHSGFAWIYPQAFTAGSYNNIISYGEADDSQWATGLALYNSTGEVVWTQDGFDAPHVGSGLTLSLNQWSFVGFMRTATEVTFFVNGNRITVASGSALVIPAGDPILIGASGHNSVIGGFFNGYIDEARFYNRTLSTDEAAQLYRLTTPTGVDTGLKGYWSFNADAMSGTTAYDRSGAGNTGTLTNSPVKTEGRVGQAIDFDGTNDYITSSDSSSLDVTDTADLTLSGWFYRDTFTTDDTIIAKRSGITSGEPGYLLYIDDATDQLIFEVADDIFDEYSLTSTNTFTTTGWYHFAVVWDQDSAANTELYINGVANNATDTGSLGPVTNLSNALDFRVGAESDAGNPFDGKIDEVRTYNRALSAAEIQSLYAVGQSDKTNTSAGQPQGTGNLNSGLAGYWKLDETTGTSAADASTNGNNGTLYNTENGDWGTGQVDNGLTLDGVDEYAQVANATPLQFANASSITLSAWIKPAQNTATATILVKGRDTDANEGNYAFRQHSAGKKLEFYYNESGIASWNVWTTTDDIFSTTGVWYHVMVTYTFGTGSSIKAYVNGVERAGSWTLGTGNVGPDVSTQVLFIGKIGTGERFNGTLDEIRVYNRALPADEVSQLYRLGTPTAVDTGLKGYWSFNGQDMSGTTAYDRSGAGNTGTLTNGPAITEGISGQALSFDGSDDYIDGVGYQFTTFTAAAWVRTSATVSNYAGIIEYSDSSSRRFGIGLDQTGDPGFVYLNASSQNRRREAAGVNADDGKWHHIVGTFDGTTPLLYYDGTLVTLGSEINDLSAPNAASDFRIGCHTTTTCFNFPGSIDESRIYNRALSASEIQAQYAAGAPDKTNTSISTPQGTGRLDSGLAGYWKLDENTGTSAADASTNGNTATVPNSWATGQIGSAVSFNGSTTMGADAYVVDNKQDITMAAWVYPRAAQAYRAWFYKGVAGCDEASAKYMLENDVAGNLRLWVGGVSSSLGTSTTLATNQWQHLVATNSATGSAIYLDGKLIASGSALPTPATSSDVWYFNRCNSIDANMDEIRLYNRALSSDEVSQLYRLTSPTGTETSLKGYWSFNGQDLSGTTAFDRSGASNNGTLTNGPAITEGKLGQGLLFDGSNDYVATGTNANITGAITISAWAKTSSTAEGYFLANRNSSSGYGFSMRGSAGSYQLRFTYFGVQDWDSSNNAYVADGLWHQYTVTNDLTNVRFYVDGVLFSTSSVAASSGISSPATLNLGTLIGNSIYFNGSLDEMRIYNRALSVSEIKALYASGK